ncbi:MAG: ribbon-helix-helix protein, CopG family [Gammaproteobacteria bacterium]|nr:ribbon-helix-helix protein, CopG family [Gammaproteobacteria bacterium]
MVRLTISLEDEMHSALKEAAARQNRSMASIIEESLQARGIQPLATARDIVARARANSTMGARQAMALALEETHEYRAGR